MLKKHKNILFALIGIILVFFGYWYFVLSKKNNTTESNSLVATAGIDTTSPDSVTNAYDKEFVANLQTVRYIDLNTKIFSMPAYKALTFPEVPFAVDYNIPAGRRNPFLPLGVDGGSAQSASVQQTATETQAPATTTATTTTPKTAPRSTR